ncbi:hypothetical protein ACH5RR_014238 [Cinchona calisaya]|uniref:RRM domain-containing protein n=1 Tax=Cinchona calisaya TaxID=153742 RepID=A0ABD3A4N5_9GENT
MSQYSEHHDHAVRGSEVFVGGLPHTVTESTIHEIFSHCGEIVEIRLIKDKKANVKGFCFVRFSTKEAAEKAVIEKSGFVLNGKKIGVLPSTEQDTLYLGNLNKGWSTYEFEGIVRQVFPDVISVDLATPVGESQSGKQRNRGFAFVKFSSHAAAARAFRVGSKEDFMLGGNLHPAVQWAEEQSEIDPAVLAKIKIAFIRNLPVSADENYLKKLFEPFGEIEKVVIARKGSSPVGFVHFTKRSDLDNAVRGMNGKTVQWPKGGSTSTLSVEVARPTDRSKKRSREDSQEKISNKVPTHLANNNPNVSYGSPLSSFHTSGAQKEVECEDPYEAAVLSLPVSIRERLLRILRLGIATRFDIDIQNLTSLKQLPESAAISVLDQFMLSGADTENKAVYLNGLISRHQVDQLLVGRSPGGLSVGDLAKRDVAVSSFSSRVHLPADNSFVPHFASTRASFTSQVPLPAVESLASPGHLSLPRSDNYLSRYSAVVSDYPILTRGSLGRSNQTSSSPLQSTSTLSTPYGRLKLSPQITEVTDRPPPRPQIRFDPFTGEPYKFDPFTGERILPDNLPHRF